MKKSDAPATLPAHFAKRHRIQTSATQAVVYPAGYKGEIPADHHAHAKGKGALADPETTAES